MRDASKQIRDVESIFSQVVPVYDFLNRLMSFREDVRWRRFVARCLRLKPGDQVLDVATGTGDLALEIADLPEKPQVVGLDLVPAMLGPARKKVAKSGANVSLINGDATCLPFLDNCFQAITIAFGIRNIPYRVLAMQEMRRVLKPGGRLYVLEFATPQHPLVQTVYKKYLLSLLPKVAGVISNNPGGYQYLAETILEFPLPDAFRREMTRAGFVGGRSHALTHGITWLHVAEKRMDHEAFVFGDRGSLGASGA
ncbi:ubiquinone/menaquinone biosynthesis methyltransferase [Dethiosulfatarculus sandiegensis]|uniref:Demethylmenaquinone methyltransferase n=1 Tax=Dethiosulfatarculus sandiegensis TaxID=1429043 RepID=A0A0D2HRL8_9BACT|nr:ubiquinone/menaquinone biosynthesis methyltransferase [Dethiosulfatarculus sandiegensis]KIX13228.1 ubiquinone biosynthesis methyltransferase UbiE [Dethiosulfatarculus sandiegensis]